MKVAIAVKDKAEATALRAAMEDPQTRAFVLVVGTLLPLGQRARRRVLEYVADKLNDEDPAEVHRIRLERSDNDAVTRQA